MKLTEEQEIVCKIFSQRDKTDRVHCGDCPMRLSNSYPVCLKALTKKDARENWDWNGSPYPALEYSADDAWWTPVTERLPKMNGEYLVTVRLFAGMDVMRILPFYRNPYKAIGFSKRTPCFVDYSDETGYYEEKNVRAWKPLPKVYKGESDAR